MWRCPVRRAERSGREGGGGGLAGQEGRGDGLRTGRGRSPAGCGLVELGDVVVRARARGVLRLQDVAGGRRQRQRVPDTLGQ